MMIDITDKITDRLQHAADYFPQIEDNPYSVFVDAKAEIERLRARVAELVTALQDATDIIQADANTEENYGSLCRMGSALANNSSSAWLMQKKADVMEQCMRDIHLLRSSFDLSEGEIAGIKMAVQHCKGQVKDFRTAADKQEIKDFRQATDDADRE